RENIARKLDDLALNGIDIVEQTGLSLHCPDDFLALKGTGYDLTASSAATATEVDVASCICRVSRDLFAHEEHVKRLKAIVCNGSTEDVDILNIEVLQFFFAILCTIDLLDLSVKLGIIDLPCNDISELVGRSLIVHLIEHPIHFLVSQRDR